MSTGYTYRWEDNIKISLRGIGRGVIDWIDLAHNMDKSKSKVK
jgi:hypothetical protein